MGQGAPSDSERFSRTCGCADDRGLEVERLRGELEGLRASLEAVEREARESREGLLRSEAKRASMQEALAGHRAEAEAGDHALRDSVCRVEETCLEAEEAILAVGRELGRVSEEGLVY